jgi:catalase
VTSTSASPEAGRLGAIARLLARAKPIKGPTIAWPMTRRLVKMGPVVIRSAVADTLTAQKKLLYLPTSVLDGIEPADPMIAIRSGEYGVSFGRRLSH